MYKYNAAAPTIYTVRTAIYARLFTMNKQCNYAFLLLALASPAAAEEPTISNEAEIRIQMDVKQEFATDLCQAELALEWYQKGPSVHVESELSNDTCGASSGSLVIRVFYRDEDGETVSADFPETWQRANDAPILLERDYYLAENIDVLRVRTRKLRCVCAAPEADQAQPK